MTTFKQTIAKVRRIGRMHERIAAAGIDTTVERVLVKMTNVQTCWGGFLRDAECHYESQRHYSGNTYQIRDLLKAEGYRWDQHKKIWGKPLNGEAGAEKLMEAICRRLAS